MTKSVVMHSRASRLQHLWVAGLGAFWNLQRCQGEPQQLPWLPPALPLLPAFCEKSCLGADQTMLQEAAVALRLRCHCHCRQFAMLALLTPACSLGVDLSGQTSASYNMRQNYERCLMDLENYLASGQVGRHSFFFHPFLLLPGLCVALGI